MASNPHNARDDSLNESMCDSDTHRVATDRKLLDDVPSMPDDGPRDLVRKKTFVLTNKDIGEESFHGFCDEEETQAEK